MFDAFAIGIAGLLCLIALIAVRVPIAYTMILVGIFGTMIQSGPAIVLNQLKDLAYAQFSNYDLSVLPMFILIFGIGFQQKVAYAAFTTAFVVLMSAAAAVESVKSDYVLVARSFGATPMQILRRVYVPSMMPFLLETLRISMIFNFTGVMIAEMYASRTGIGHLIASWGENFQMPQLFAGVILLAAVAIAFNETVRWLEGRCSTWRS